MIRFVSLTSRLLVAIPALVGFSLATGGVRAQTPTAASEAAVADAVELKNGGYLRGLIVEVEPGSHLSLRLANGEVRRIPVSEIESADHAGKPVNLGVAPAAPSASPDAATPGPGAAAVAPLAPAAASAAAPAPVTPQGTSELDRILMAIPGPRVKLEFHANRTSYLERRIGDPDDNAVAYHLVCKLPCQLALPAADAVPYRIGDLRLQPTEWFQLPKYNARVRADLASDMWPVWTRSMLVGGVVFGLVGGSMYGINELSGKKEWARDTGLVLMGVSGAFFVASGLFWLLSPHSSYVVERAE
jgi:hypothetical protein